MIRGLLDSAVLSRLRARCDHFATAIAPELPPSIVIYDEPDGTIRHITDVGVHDHGSVWGEAEAHPGVLALAEQVLLPSRRLQRDPPDGAAAVSSEVFWKPAGAGWRAPAHQDNAYVFYRPGRCDAAAVWIALDDAGAASGGLRYALGSHRLGNLPHVLGTEPPFSKAMTAEALRSIEPDSQSERRHCPWVDIDLSAGDAVCHSYLTIHASGPNESELPRRGLVLNITGQEAEVDGGLRAAHAKAVAKQRGVAEWRLAGDRPGE